VLSVCLVCVCVCVRAREPSHKVKRRFPLDTVVGESSIIMELVASKHQALLNGRDA